MTTPTPRTDAYAATCSSIEQCDLDFMQELERELAAAQERLQSALLFIAETGHKLPDPMYIETMNREGLAEDCKQFAGEKVNADYLQVEWQTKRAIAAEARAEENARDAERYRWLRDVHAYHYTVTRYIGGATIPRLNGASLDAAIDAAIAGEKP